MTEGANPKQQYGDRKVPVQLVPPAALAYIALGTGEGARKYGAFNWRETRVESMTYVGAMLRHLMSYLDGEDIDPESGNPHLAHLMASAAILADATESGQLIDNRPPSGPAGAVMRKYMKPEPVNPEPPRTMEVRPRDVLGVERTGPLADPCPITAVICDPIDAEAIKAKLEDLNLELDQALVQGHLTLAEYETFKDHYGRYV